MNMWQLEKCDHENDNVFELKKKINKGDEILNWAILLKVNFRNKNTTPRNNE